MKKIIILYILIVLSLIGCNQDSTKKKVYSESWDGVTVIVQQINNEGPDETVNEINDANEVKKLIKVLKRADWQDNIDVDIRPADFHFTWNSFKHDVWINKDSKRIELTIEGRSNYVNLSKKASETVLKILTGKRIEQL